MLVQNTQFDGPTLELFAKADIASRAIPPMWALAETVAVNPFLGQTSEPLMLTAARLEKVAGVRVTQLRTDLVAKIDKGDITLADLDAAIAANPDGLPATAADLYEAASSHMSPAPVALPTIAGLAADVSGIDWPRLIEERIGHWAASHFDAGQALWPAPAMAAFPAWHGFAKRDITPEIQGLKGFSEYVSNLPPSGALALAYSAETLGVMPQEAELYFHRLLSTLGGWAQLARRGAWAAEQSGARDEAVTDLLCIRIVWEAALFEMYRAEIGAVWLDALAEYAKPLAPTADHRIDCALQLAAELAAQRKLVAQMGSRTPVTGPERAAVQAAFCIDVRSEVFRRALENQSDEVETVGFAGFFGLTITHQPVASDVTQALAPVLLSPALRAKSGHSAEQDTDLRLAARAKRAWGRFRQAAVGSFAFVEAAGPLYLPKLIKDTFGAPAKVAGGPVPVLTTDLSLEAKVTAAKTVLGAMSLRAPFARVVMITGHGAEVVNTPFESAMHCGACGGNTGEVNVRILAQLLNDPEVRAQIDVPADTLFVGALHHTTSDRVDMFDADVDAGMHSDDIKRLKLWLKAAGAEARAERAGSLPGAKTQADLVARGLDWAQVRPEWGLAGCSKFIAAPRELTRGLDLGGQAFLHTYNHHADAEKRVLELILTAPVVVASWISLQYYGSAVAPEAFGGGNKLVHNITGGVGVVEGNGGNLRAGLPLQSVHDGDTLRHEPLRLSVVIAAPIEDMNAVLEKHPSVADLFDNQWLHLLAMDDEGQITARYDGHGNWSQIGGQAALMAAE